jgi:hypothetical protein
MGVLNLEEVALVDHLQNEFLDVIGLVGSVGHQRVEGGLDARAIVEFADRDVDEAILVTGPEDLERVDDDTTVAASAT